MSIKKIRYENVERDGIERQIRWNSLQIIAKILFDNSKPTDEIVEIARAAREDGKQIVLKIKK